MKTQKKPISNKELLTSLRSEPEYRAAEKRLETKMLVARNVLRYRADRRLTQKQLAEKAGMKQPRIADIESMRGNPSLDTLEKIAVALEVNASDLLLPPQQQLAYRQPTQSHSTQSQRVNVDLLDLLQRTVGVRFEGKVSNVAAPMPFIESPFVSHQRLKLPH